MQPVEYDTMNDTFKLPGEWPREPIDPRDIEDRAAWVARLPGYEPFTHVIVVGKGRKRIYYLAR